MKHGKKYIDSKKLIDPLKFYEPAEAIELVKQTGKAKFDETVELSIRLGVDPRHADQQVRGAVVLPHGTGKVVRVLVFAKGPKAEEAKAAGADYVGDVDMLEKIQTQNWFDFDVIVATPDMMGELGKMGRVLGPKGLMPNPKTGTVTMEIGNAVTEIKKGKIAYRVDKDGNLNISCGRVSFSEADLLDNLSALTEHIVKSRPASVKGIFIKNAVIHTTMGPAVHVTFAGRN